MLLFQSPLLFEYAYVLILLTSSLALWTRLEKRRQKKWVFVFAKFEHENLWTLCDAEWRGTNWNWCHMQLFSFPLAKCFSPKLANFVSTLEFLFNITIGLCIFACETKAILIIVLPQKQFRVSSAMLSQLSYDFAQSFPILFIIFRLFHLVFSIINANKFVSSFECLLGFSWVGCELNSKCRVEWRPNCFV